MEKIAFIHSFYLRELLLPGYNENIRSNTKLIKGKEAGKVTQHMQPLIQMLAFVG